MKSILNRYLFLEAARTWLAVTVVLLLILLTNQFATVLGDAAADKVPRDALMFLMWLTMVQYLTILVPVSFFLSVMLALARLYHDSEMAALMACGVAPRDLYRPLFTLAVLLALLVGWLALFVSPAAIRDIQDLREQARRQASVELLEAGRFLTSGGGETVLYAESVGEDGHLRNVFVKRQVADRTEVVIAREAWQVISEQDNLRVLTFGQGTRYEGQPGSAAFRIIRFQEHGIPFALPPAGPVIFKPEARTVAELRASGTAADVAELQWRLSAPMTVLVLTLLAVPLARTEPRRGRFSGLASAVLIYVIYANLMGAGKVWIERGVLPAALGMWWVHALFGLAAVGLLLHHEGLTRQLRRRPVRSEAAA